MSDIILIEDFITEAEEQQLINLATTYPGNYRHSPGAPGRMIRFGSFEKTQDLIVDSQAKAEGYKSYGRRSYSTMNDGIDVSIDVMPDNITALGLRLVEASVVTATPAVAVLNVYKANQRIGRHIDHKDNGPVIPVVGLQSDSELIFTTRDKSVVKRVKFPRRAMLAISGDARNVLFHETPAIATPRMSLVFRCLPSPVPL